jgi:hypothetical protein
MKVTNPSWKVFNLRQPQPDWLPKPGRLIVRQMLTLSNMEINFEYRLPNTHNGPNAYKGIACVNNWVGVPDFSGSVECIRSEADETGEGNFVVRRYAYMADLLALRRLWSKHSGPFVEWIETVLNKADDLDMESRLMLNELCPSDNNR